MNSRTPRTTNHQFAVIKSGRHEWSFFFFIVTKAHKLTAMNLSAAARRVSVSVFATKGTRSLVLQVVLKVEIVHQQSQTSTKTSTCTTFFFFI